MPTPKNNSRRLLLTVGLLFIGAIIGLATLNTAPVTAQQALKTGQTETITSDKAGATVGGETVSSSPVTNMSAVSSILRMLSALVVVVICIYGAVFALKRFMGRKIAGRGSQGILEVLETAHLGPKKMVSVVRVADRSVLVGITENQITLLTELDETKTAEITASDAQPVVHASFGEMLKTATDKIKELSRGKPKTALADK